MKEFQIGTSDDIRSVIGKISLTERFISLIESSPEISTHLLCFMFENNEDGSRQVVGVRALPIPAEPAMKIDAERLRSAAPKALGVGRGGACT